MRKLEGSADRRGKMRAIQRGPRIVGSQEDNLQLLLPF